MPQTATLEGFTITPDWIMAGKAIFTVSNGQGEHYTYSVKRGKDNGDGRPAVWFVSLLTGPDNMSDYTYVGCLLPRTGGVRLTRASRLTESSTPYRVVDWALKRLWAGIPLPEGYSLNGEGRCGCCGRRLTHPDGVDDAGYRLGYGPTCYAKMRG